MEKPEIAAPGLLRQSVVLACLALFAALGTDTLVREDARLGWGMFTYQTRYKLRYEWLYSDGSTRPQRALDLRGKVEDYLADRRRHRTRYGLGALQRWMESYARHMYRSHRKDKEDAVAFRAVAMYSINDGELRTLLVQYPEGLEPPSAAR